LAPKLLLDFRGSANTLLEPLKRGEVQHCPIAKYLGRDVLEERFFVSDKVRILLVV
jgi:hypothetical protein